MVSRSTDSEIKRYRKKIRAIKPQADTLRQRLVKESIPFLSSWYEQAAKEFLSRSCVSIEQFDEKKLKAMKKEVCALAAAAPGIVEEELEDMRIWWPFQENESADEIPQFLSVEDALRFSMGRIFPVLEKFGLFPDPNEARKWSKQDASAKGLRRWYPYDAGFPKKIRLLIEQYKKLFLRTCPVSAKLIQLYKRKQKEEAQGLWDSI